MIREEIIKIVSLKKLLLFLGFTLLYFMLFLRPYVKVNPGSYQYEAEIGAEIIERYGNQLSAEEFEHLKAAIPVETPDEIDRFIAGNEWMGRKGFASYQDVFDKMEGLTKEEQIEAWGILYGQFGQEEIEAKIDKLMKRNYWMQYLELYENKTGSDTKYYENLDAAQRERVESRSTEEITAVLPGSVLKNNMEVLQFLSAFMLLSVIFFIVPYMVADNMAHMLPMQYTSVKGRKFFVRKLAAVLIVSIALIGSEAAIYFVIARINRIPVFWESSVSSFASRFISWFPLTLGELTLSAMGISAVLALGLACLTAAITRFCSNYITAIACQLPLVVFSGIFGGILMIAYTEIIKAPWAAIGTGAVGTCIGVAVLIGVCVREQRADIY